MAVCGGRQSAAPSLLRSRGPKSKQGSQAGPASPGLTSSCPALSPQDVHTSSQLAFRSEGSSTTMCKLMATEQTNVVFGRDRASC